MRSNKIKNILCLLLASQMLVCVSCGAVQTGNEAGSDDTKNNDPFNVETVTPPDTEPVTDTTEADTTAAPEPIEPDIINPLTGLEAEVDYENRRPIAIMINNIKEANPQEGVSYADIMYECIVEGGLTRLMMVVSDYEKLPVVGSVRSSREYYLDFAANHDAIYMHAGGSNQAYVELKSRKVDNLDGVNDNVISYKCFYRDAWREANMGYVHSLVTTGERIVDGIKYKKYDTTLTENFDSPLDFVPYNTVRLPEGGDASYLQVSYSLYHQPYFEYNEEEGAYYRWQFRGDKHMDKGADIQLSFANVIVLYCKTASTNDSYKHMDVTTTGSGEGYYLYGGKYEKITWEKADEDTPVKLYNESGEELLVNRGKTFFQICTVDMKPSTVIR